MGMGGVRLVALQPLLTVKKRPLKFPIEWVFLEVPRTIIDYFKIYIGYILRKYEMWWWVGDCPPSNHFESYKGYYNFWLAIQRAPPKVYDHPFYNNLICPTGITDNHCLWGGGRVVILKDICDSSFDTKSPGVKPKKN